MMTANETVNFVEVARRLRLMMRAPLGETVAIAMPANYGPQRASHVFSPCAGLAVNSARSFFQFTNRIQMLNCQLAPLEHAMTCGGMTVQLVWPFLFRVKT